MDYRVFFAVILLWLACEAPAPTPPEGMVYIPGNSYEMGGRSSQAYQDEFPRHTVEVSPFFMDKTEVTNRQFAAFVEATGYITVAERAIDWEEMKKDLPPDTPQPPDSTLQPGSMVFKPTSVEVDLSKYHLWWDWRTGANWRQPEGTGSSIEDRMDYPVVQVAWEDAKAYAEWGGKRLPTEAEWEWAATGGNNKNKYPWGNGSIETAWDKANFWQGGFPYYNDTLDGYFGAAPVKSYPSNDFGLYDMAGNVWEWCADRYHVAAYEDAAQSDTRKDPQGPETSYDPLDPYVKGKYVMRGGSYLCNDSYCSGYRNSRRMPSEASSGANHKGFRCVKDVSF